MMTGQELAIRQKDRYPEIMLAYRYPGAVSLFFFKSKPGPNQIEAMKQRFFNERNLGKADKCFFISLINEDISDRLCNFILEQTGIVDTTVSDQMTYVSDQIMRILMNRAFSPEDNQTKTDEDAKSKYNSWIA
jgi:hypothetical protein